MSQTSTQPVKGHTTAATSISEMVSILQSEELDWLLVLTNALLVDCGEMGNYAYLLLLRDDTIQNTEDGDSDTFMDYLREHVDIENMGPLQVGRSRVPEGTAIYIIEVQLTVNLDWLGEMIARYIHEQKTKIQ
jgi:hypothetical protein